MRKLSRALLAVALGLAAVGCSSKSFDGPTVDAFNGRLVQAGKPVSFPAGEEVVLQLFHQSAQSFGVPIQPDGSFQIGWMPVGKYSATLIREKKSGKGEGGRYNVPGGLTIADGQTEYTIDLGKGYKS